MLQLWLEVERKRNFILILLLFSVAVVVGVVATISVNVIGLLLHPLVSGISVALFLQWFPFKMVL